MAKKTTLYIDTDLLERVRKYIRPRGISAFVNELLAERLAALERRELEEQMRAGYLATVRDREELNVEAGCILSKS